MNIQHTVPPGWRFHDSPKKYLCRNDAVYRPYEISFREAELLRILG